MNEILKAEAPVHVFDNGIQVYRHHLIAVQEARYAQQNLHEPEEEAWFLRLLEQIEPGPGVFCDVGAAIGYYVLLAKKVRPDLEAHAFEPLELHREYLRANLALNGMDRDQVTIHPKAISSRAGKARFQQHHYASVLASEPGRPGSLKQWLLARLMRRRCAMPPGPVTPPGETPVFSMVETATLSEVAARLKLPIRLVKVDVQGFELEVLRGAVRAIKQGRIEAWLIGTHSEQIHQDCLSFLERHDFRILYENARPEHQPDGIIAAARRGVDRSRRRG